MALSLLAPGCEKAPSREYTVPETLCGRAIDPEVVKPLLPPGRRLTAYQGLEDDDDRTCFINVDRTSVLYIREAVTGGPADAAPRVKPYDGLRRVKLGPDGDSTVLWNKGALSVNPCVHKGERINYVFEVDVYAPDPKKPDIERFAKAYVSVGKPLMGCGS
ncbi:hypothetical protein [Streptomyces sp. URMC 123]|uniref:hypothetical protein n=1 Tax=Streptomyces sp. URMC 123 TaxID=3423403 RepID=UPI003F1A89B4